MAHDGRDEARRPAKTVWILNHYATPPGSGAGTRHHDLGQELARLGWRVTIFAAGFNHFTGREEQLTGARMARTEMVGRVRFVWLRTTPYRGNGARRIVNMATYFVTVMLVAQRARPRPDAIIGSTVHPLAGLAAYLLSRELGARFYYEIRDLWPQTLIDIGAMRPDHPAARVLRRLEGFLVARAAAVIGVMPGLGTYLDEHGQRPRVLEHVPNGVSLGQAGRRGPLPAPASELLARWSDRCIVAYTGAHGTANGLGAVLEAAAILEGRGAAIGFAMVGDGPEKRNLQAERDRRGLTNVAFLEPMGKDALATFLDAADVGLMSVAPTPIHRYGVSFNKVFDYMAAARPIVFACDTPFDPVAESGAGVTVPPDDPVRLADAIASLAELPPERRAALGARGRTHVEEAHDIAKLAARLDALLRREPAAAVAAAR